MRKLDKFYGVNKKDVASFSLHFHYTFTTLSVHFQYIFTTHYIVSQKDFLVKCYYLMSLIIKKAAGKIYSTEKLFWKTFGNS